MLSVEFHFLQEADAGVYVLVHDLVDVDKVHALAVVGHKTLDEGAALETFLVTEVECLSGIEEFDGHDALGVFHDLIALCGSVAAHADEVFLVLTAGDAVDAAGGAELFALADDGGGSVLRSHLCYQAELPCLQDFVYLWTVHHHLHVDHQNLPPNHAAQASPIWLRHPAAAFSFLECQPSTTPNGLIVCGGVVLINLLLFKSL